MIRAQAKPAVTIEVVIESERWDAEPLAARTIREAIGAAAREISAPVGEVAVMLIDDEAMRALNRQWRGLDKPTNVLSFPAAPLPGAPGASRLGDIAVAFETTAREAAGEDKSLAQHLAHLAVHGYLHLLGYDHETVKDAETMERTESAILAKLGIPDPYAARASETPNDHA
jgi:probable rRNA maturation factor